jgi:hypothetical protein
MDPKHLFFDERFRNLCVYCGEEPATRDHVPSLIFLDLPYPQDLPVVPACKNCNQGCSKDELYVACLLDCAVSGSVASCSRPKVKAELREHQRLARRLLHSRFVDENGQVWWRVESERLTRVVVKLARGHAAYEDAEPMLDEPVSTEVALLCLMPEDDVASFESELGHCLRPEYGSRAFLQMLRAARNPGERRWTVVQEGRYRYCVDRPAGKRVKILVRIVLNEYLACAVAWS